MSGYVIEDYRKHFTALLTQIGKQDAPHVPLMDTTSAKVLAFDLEQRSELAVIRASLDGVEGQEALAAPQGLSTATPEDAPLPAADSNRDALTKMPSSDASEQIRAKLAAKLDRLRERG